MHTSEVDIENTKVTGTIVFDADQIRSDTLKLKVIAYPLPENEFERLSKSGTGFKEWSTRFLLISIGALILTIAKLIDFLLDYRSAEDKNLVDIEIKNYEIIALSISLGSCIISYLLSRIFRNKKDQLIKKIGDHFNAEKND